jgi:2-polyprenyl-3-methyl-5-hydroxy-6-metoxy-1,4-benzoquinol methylase
MQRFESIPSSPLVSMGGLSEVFNHSLFLNGTDEVRRKIMLQSAEEKYQSEVENPFDQYFNIDLLPFLKGKVIMDLGCFTGGRSVAWCERYDPMLLVGIDVKQEYIEAARQFAEIKGVQADFKLARGEHLPSGGEEFDAILSYDVFEHVQDLSKTLSECHRVLKVGGQLIVVFPSYFHPTEHHLGLVTRVPAIHYFFGGSTLVNAYYEICRDRGSEADWYARKYPKLEDWERGNTINGTTLSQFRRLLKSQHWKVILHGRKPIGSLMRGSSLKETGKLVSYALYPFVFLPFFEEIFLNRVVYVLEKKAI